MSIILCTLMKKMMNVWKKLLRVAVFLLVLLPALQTKATLPSLPGEYTQTASYNAIPSGRYLRTENRNGQLVNVWEFEIEFNKPANHKIDLAMNFIETLESGQKGIRITEIRTDRGTTLPLTVTSTQNSDLMKTARHKIDVNHTAFSHITEETKGKIIYTVEEPVVTQRTFYNLNVFMENKIELKRIEGSNDGTGTTSGVTTKDLSKFLSPTSFATYANDMELNFYNAQYNSPFLLSQKKENMFIAGDYIKASSTGNVNQIKWTLSVPNDSTTHLDPGENQTFHVPLDFDSSQTLSSANLILYKPGLDGFVQVSSQPFRGGDIVVPPNHLAQVVVITDDINKEVKKTFNGAELDSLRQKIKIKKEWLDDATPVPITFRLSNQDSFLGNVTLQPGQTQYTDTTSHFKYVLVNNEWKRVNFNVTETVPEGYFLVQSVQNTSTLEFSFYNDKVFVPPADNGACQQYGVFEVGGGVATDFAGRNYNYVKDNVTIYEYFNRQSVHTHGGMLMGKFRIPPRARAGDYFDFTLPPELKFETSPNPDKVYFEIHNTSGLKIGEAMIMNERTLRFRLNSNAYSETAYEGTFRVGHAIYRSASDQEAITRIGGVPVTGGQYEYHGIIPDVSHLTNGTTAVREKINFTSTYHGDIGDCNPVTSNPFYASTTYNDAERHRHGLIRKELRQFGTDYIIYDILFNGAGADRGTGEHTFVEMLNSTISLYSGDPYRDIELYEVNRIPNSYGYDENSLRPAAENFAVLGPNNFGYNFPVQLTSRVDIKIRNIQSKTFLARIKVRKRTPYNGEYYNAVYSFTGGTRGNEHRFVGRKDAEHPGTATVSFKNKYNVRLVKKKAGSLQTITDNPATFELLNHVNGAPGRVIDTGRTGQDGSILFNDLDKYLGTQGIYYIREKIPPVGYEKSDDVIRVTIKSDNSIWYNKIGQREVSYNSSIGINYLNNPVQYYSFTVRKVGTDGRPLLGSIFRLYNEDASYNVTIGENEVADAYTFNSLLKGRYTLEEVKAPDGYEKIQPIQIEVQENGMVKLSDTTHVSATDITYNATNKNGTMSVYNKKFTDFSLKKIKAGSEGQTLDGARFALYKKGANSNTPGEKIGEYTTANGGVISFSRLENGGYYLKEVESPSGYRLNEKFYEINLLNGTAYMGSSALIQNSDGTYSTASQDGLFALGAPQNGQTQFLFANKSLTEFSLKKVVLGEETTTIDGVTFDLYKRAADRDVPGTKVTSATTANGGVVRFNGLEAGEYYLKEAAVPATTFGARGHGYYVVNERYYKIHIDDRGQVTLGDNVWRKKADNTYEKADNDQMLTEDRDLNSSIRFVFKNPVRYKISLEKNVLSGKGEPRIHGMKFMIRPADGNPATITYVEKKLGGLRGWEPIPVVNGQVDGKSIPEGALVWIYTEASGTLSQQAAYWNPIFELPAGKYIIEEFGAYAPGYESLGAFEIEISKEGQVSITGFTKDTTYSSGAIGGSNASGDRFVIYNDPSRTGKYATNNALHIHIFNKKPLRFYLDKKKGDNTRITNGQLTIKWEGAMIFDKDGQKVDEKTFNLATDYVDNKGLRIDVPRELPSGTYILTEVAAPNGYNVTPMRYHIEVNQAKRTVKLLRTDEGPGINVVNIPSTQQLLYTDEWNYTTKQLVERVGRTVDIINKRKEYPKTGGLGNFFFLLGGSLAMGVSLVNRKRR